MKLTNTELEKIATEWRAARRLYPVYTSIAGQFELLLPACADLESPIDRSEPEVLTRIREWLDAAEAVISAYQLRVYCQTAAHVGEPTLRAIAARHLAKPAKTVADRDKLDFLLVQYFAQCAPMNLHRDDVHLDEVARVLEPIVGDFDADAPDWAHDLEDALRELCCCTTLNQLLACGVLGQVRELKARLGDQYFVPAASLRFARYNFQARRLFFRLVRHEVDQLRAGLRELAARGVKTVDCSQAQLGPAEPVAVLQQFCETWKQPFRAEYSAGARLDQITRVGDAVARTLGGSPAEAPAEVESAGDDAPAVPLPANAAAPQDAVAALRQELRQQLVAEHGTAAGQGKNSVHVVIAGTRVLLSSWEVRAFVGEAQESSDDMQSAVAARLLLDLELARARRGAAHNLRAALVMAHAEAADLQERIAQARETRDIDAAVTLAATAKRLAQLMDEAARVSPPVEITTGAPQ